MYCYRMPGASQAVVFLHSLLSRFMRTPQSHLQRVRPIKDLARGRVDEEAVFDLRTSRLIADRRLAAVKR